MTGEELLNDLGVRIYQKPLSNIRRLPTWPSLSNPLHVAVLLIDFDTEVAMNSILGFLENSTGAYLGQTIDALHLVNANATAETLGRIRDAMSKHEVSHERLRSPHRNTTEYQITSFAALHGPSLDDFADEACRIADDLYIHDRTKESPFPLLETFLERHETEVLSEIERLERGHS
jgi:hypothetical protein